MEHWKQEGAGLSGFGTEVVTRLLNEQSIWCDVSHLSEAAFGIH